MAAVAVFRISTIKLAGAEGEERTLRQLKTLPSAYTLFNQLDIPSAPSRTGAMEADLVVVGPNGVFVIEVKHNNGTIFGDNASPQWPVAKVGPRGGAYQSAMRNPIRQLGGRLHGFQLWVNLPRADKWTPPRYQEISTVDIPEVALDGGSLPGVDDLGAADASVQLWDLDSGERLLAFAELDAWLGDTPVVPDACTIVAPLLRTLVDGAGS